MNIKALETGYAGHRFRSRLEARWAVFFDAAEIPWRYEPEGFDIDGEWYLPDFLLPECGTWVEVKGVLTNRDRELLPKAARILPNERQPGCERGPCLMLVGDIPRLEPVWDDRDISWASMPIHDHPDRKTRSMFPRYGFGLYRKNHRPWWESYSEDLSPVGERDEGEYMSLKTQAAYRKARAARFEHGEKG